MADIQIFITNQSAAESGDDIVYQGQARLEGMDSSDKPVVFFALVATGALAATCNNAIRDAAIAAARAICRLA